MATHGLAPGVIAELDQSYAGWLAAVDAQIRFVRDGLTDPDTDGWPEALIANEYARRLCLVNHESLSALVATAILRLARTGIDHGDRDGC